MSLTTIIIIATVSIILVGLWGFLYHWSLKKIAFYTVIIGVLISGLMMLNNYSIFIIAILLAIFFEYKRR